MSRLPTAPPSMRAWSASVIVDIGMRMPRRSRPPCGRGLQDEYCGRDGSDKWVKNKHLDAADLQAYCEALAEISLHRHDTNMVNLVDHVRVHRLIMAVLGRLVDYVGLFERDLYFATLVLLHRKGLRLEDLLEKKA